MEMISVSESRAEMFELPSLESVPNSHCVKNKFKPLMILVYRYHYNTMMKVVISFPEVEFDESIMKREPLYGDMIRQSSSKTTSQTPSNFYN